MDKNDDGRDSVVQLTFIAMFLQVCTITKQKIKEQWKMHRIMSVFLAIVMTSLLITPALASTPATSVDLMKFNEDLWKF